MFAPYLCDELDLRRGQVDVARQQVNAVESVSNVDVVCTDKTGTLTTGRLTLAEVAPLGGRTAAEVEAALGGLARSATSPNLTTSALAASLPGSAWVVRDDAYVSARWPGDAHLFAKTFATLLTP